MISANFPKFRLKIDLDYSGLDFKGLVRLLIQNEQWYEIISVIFLQQKQYDITIM